MGTYSLSLELSFEELCGLLPEGTNWGVLLDYEILQHLWYGCLSLQERKQLNVPATVRNSGRNFYFPEGQLLTPEVVKQIWKISLEETKNG
jgi:hypothetical protein